MMTDIIRNNPALATTFVATLAGFALGCAFERMISKSTGYSGNDGYEVEYEEYEDRYYENDKPDIDDAEEYDWLTTREEEIRDPRFVKPSLRAYWEHDEDDSKGDKENWQVPNETPGEGGARVLTQDEYMNLPSNRMNCATYFVEDEILAGVNLDLDELDPEEVFGGIPKEAIESLKDGSTSGVYVLCGDGRNGLEIIASHGNFLEEHEILASADEVLTEKANDIADKAGYSGGARPSGRSRG